MISNVATSRKGFSARVIKNGAYGFASSAGWTPEIIAEVVASAEENATFLDAHEHLNQPRRTPFAPFQREDGMDAEDSTSQKEIIAYLSELDAWIAQKYPNLISRYVMASCLGMEKLLYTTDGVRSHSIVPRSSVGLQLTVEASDGTPVELYQPFSVYGTFREKFRQPMDLAEDIDTLYTQLMQKREGIYADAGRRQVILHPDLAGMLAHEAVGHTVEADFVRSGSVGGPYFGKQVASELVTMVDFAHTALGKPCPVPVYVDDEGTPAEDAVLIQNGVLTGYMHNRESAAHFGHKPQGNARAFSFSDEPLIRMRNTCILPGKDRLEDLIASVEDGYYLLRTSNGQADATGEFTFGVNMGYEIRHGKLGRALRDTTISGVAFDMLHTVDMVSDDLRWSMGMCGKKQMIPVATGGPAIRAMVNIGGR